MEAALFGSFFVSMLAFLEVSKGFVAIRRQILTFTVRILSAPKTRLFFGSFFVAFCSIFSLIWAHGGLHGREVSLKKLPSIWRGIFAILTCFQTFQKSGVRDKKPGIFGRFENTLKWQKWVFAAIDTVYAAIYKIPVGL